MAGLKAKDVPTKEAEARTEEAVLMSDGSLIFSSNPGRVAAEIRVERSRREGQPRAGQPVQGGRHRKTRSIWR